MDTTVPNSPDIPEPVQDFIHPDSGWHQRVYRFGNSLGASVMVAPDRPDRGSDLVIIQWTSEQDWHVVGLDTAERVFGVGEFPDGLSEAEVRERLAKIQAYTDPAAVPPPGCVDCQYRITDRGEVTDFAAWAEAVDAYAALRRAGRTPRVWHRHRTEPWRGVTNLAEDAVLDARATSRPRVCVGCGHTITLVQPDGDGVWIDDLKRGHCTALHGGHRPSMAGTPAGGAR